MRRFAETKDDPIAEIPAIVGVGPIAIQPPMTVGVALDVPNVRIAVGIRTSLTRAASSYTPLLEILILSELNFMRDQNHSIQRAKYLHFFKISHITMPEK